MKIYIAHNMAARSYLVGGIKALEKLGHEVTSRWITDDSHIQHNRARESATADLEDIDRADAILLYTEQYGPKHGKGKFIELGYALAKGKKCYLIGENISSVFYYLPQITQIINYSEIPL